MVLVVNDWRNVLVRTVYGCPYEDVDKEPLLLGTQASNGNPRVLSWCKLDGRDTTFANDPTVTGEL
jgi:hypothetical protein